MSSYTPLKTSDICLIQFPWVLVGSGPLFSLGPILSHVIPYPHPHPHLSQMN